MQEIGIAPASGDAGGPAPAAPGTRNTGTSSMSDTGARMASDYGVTMKCCKVKSHYVYSKEDADTQTMMYNEKQLCCGHFHMGEFRICSSCSKTMCARCWNYCPDPVMGDLLSAEVSEVVGREWKNTCKVCSSTKSQYSCANDCPGRQKYLLKFDLDTLPLQTYFLPDESLVFGCDCETCKRKQVAHTNNTHCENTPCLALRGYEVDVLNLRKM